MVHDSDCQHSDRISFTWLTLKTGNIQFGLRYSTMLFICHSYQQKFHFQTPKFNLLFCKCNIYFNSFNKNAGMFRFAFGIALNVMINTVHV